MTLLLYGHQPKHYGTLQATFRRSVSGTIRWKEIEALFSAFCAEIDEREGSRVAVIFPGKMPAIFQRPHPSPMTDKGAINVICQWPTTLGYTPEGI